MVPRASIGRSLAALWLGGAVLLTTAARGENWPQFRGPTGLGYSSERDLPAAWGGEAKENVVWEAPLIGSGHASPIVWEDRILISTVWWPDGIEDRTKHIPEHHVLCYGTRDGALLWDRVVTPGPWTRTDFRSGPGGGYAAPTPATDGRIVVCAFGSAVIAALDLEGKILWRQDIIPYSFDVTLGSSPILVGETVVLLCAMAERADSRVVFYHGATGAKVRETKLAGMGFGHSTPVIVDIGGKPQMLIAASGAEASLAALRALDPMTGAILWTCAGSAEAASPAFSGGIVYFDSGRWGPGTALRVPEPRATAPGSRASQSEEGRTARALWKKDQVPEGIGSPIIVEGRVYRLHAPGVLRVWDAETGEEVYAKRLEGIGTTWASPVATADGRLYFASAGKSYVVGAGPEFRLLGSGDLGDPNHASPAVAAGRLYLAGQRMIYCVGTK